MSFHLGHDRVRNLLVLVMQTWVRLEFIAEGLHALCKCNRAALSKMKVALVLRLRESHCERSFRKLLLFVAALG